MADYWMLGKFKIASTLGAGVVDTVHRGFAPGLGWVAVKTIRKDLLFNGRKPADLTRFRAEIQAAARLAHPNIATIYEVGDESSMAFIAMEIIEGLPLKTLLDKGRRPSLAAAPLIMTQILSALGHAHGQGVLHRGLKPDNIYLCDGVTVKITNFAVGGFEPTPDRAPTPPPYYKAPEQLQGTAEDARTDLYAAGAVLYHLLCGAHPFEGISRTIREEVLTMAPARPSLRDARIPPALDEIVLRALAKKPADRFQSAAEFQAALDEACKGLTEKQPAAVPAEEADAPVAAPVREAAVEPATAEAPRRIYERRSLAVGDYLFHEGDVGDVAFLIESGAVQILKTVEGGQDIVLATLGRGEILGEMALVDQQPRMASARALDNCSLVIVPREEFSGRLTKVDKVTQKLIATLVKRMRSMGDEIAALKQLGGLRN